MRVECCVPQLGGKTISLVTGPNFENRVDILLSIARTCFNEADRDRWEFDSPPQLLEHFGFVYHGPLAHFRGRHLP